MEENTNAIELLEMQKLGKINDATFLKEFGKEKLFYSTPFGDHKDGSKKLFLLPGPDNTGYNPVFTSPDRLKEFYDRAGRATYMMMNGPFVSVLEVTKKVNENAPIKMGLIIDPGYYGVTIDAKALDTVINMCR